ncbi:hypothetical protein [Bradyrhizobium sp. SZCCHNRI1058]|uniref:hypothetical protein n=1 Tax=Bradyrhizobium sp. SZCCHNRI1058 TaxID=3057279 RepID=UPI0029166750|nr:hypothetical protein [Bradyrhizobium sp. SZCCHNRI1058]
MAASKAYDRSAQEHLAVRRALDQSGAKERQAFTLKLGVSVIGHPRAQGENLGEEQPVGNLAVRGLAAVADAAYDDERLAQIRF